MVQMTEVTATVELDAEQIAKMFEDEFDGWCPACKNETINDGEIICDSCFADAERFPARAGALTARQQRQGARGGTG